MVTAPCSLPSPYQEMKKEKLKASHKSHLLFSWFGSTVPGLIQVRDRRAGSKVEVGRAIMRQFPDFAEDPSAGGFAALFVLDQLLNSDAELIEVRVVVLPRV